MTAKNTKARLLTYALPHLQGKTMAGVTRDDIETIVRALDERVDLAETDESIRFTWKTALNVWGDVTRAFDEAVNSKDRSVRIHTADPPATVRGPDRGDEREKPFLYPSEVEALLGCCAVPLYWRRMYAVAIYTGTRSNELAALTGADVDFEHSKIHITKQIDRETGKPRPTKTRRVRTIDVEPALEPLLRVLVVEAEASGRARAEALGTEKVEPVRLLRMPPDEDRAELLREKHLRAAGCKREALYASSARR